jgi:hypothetical protein
MGERKFIHDEAECLTPKCGWREKDALVRDVNDHTRRGHVVVTSDRALKSKR